MNKRDRFIYSLLTKACLILCILLSILIGLLLV